MTDRITIRLGPLAEPLNQHCRETGETPAEVARRGLARELGVAEPEMIHGNPSIGEQSAKGVKARWGKRRKVASTKTSG